MDYESLKKRIREGCKQFDKTEVRDCIEDLTEAQATALAQDRDLMDYLMAGVKDLREELKKCFVERDELIEIGLACFIAHLPMVALGPPGTAKSNVFRVLSKGLGLQDQPMSIAQLAQEMDQLARSASEEPALPAGTTSGARQSRGYFEYLVTRFTTPEELLGPAHLSLMINRAVFYRQTLGLLPEAEVAFLDEIFKANSAILNALLSIMNERLFYNAGRPTRVPLCMVFGASNEPPEDKELSALYDRFPVRVPCLPIEDTSEDRQELLQKSLKQACDELFHHRAREQGSGNGNGIKQLATVNHFRLLHKVVHVKYGGRLPYGEESRERFLRAYYKTFGSLRREFEISDRSYYKLYALARGLAQLRGKDALGPEELDVFKFCFHDLEAAAPLREAVQERKRRY
jgi:MoxR-like ATPase